MANEYGNYGTLIGAASTANTTFTNGNREIINTSSTAENAFVSIPFPTTGKTYVEFTLVARSSSSTAPSFGLTPKPYSAFGGGDHIYLTPDGAAGDEYDLYIDTSLTTQDYMVIAVGSVVQIAYDADTGKVWFGDDNTFVGNPAGGSTQAGTLAASGEIYYLTFRLRNDADVHVNTGQTAFAHTPPTGFNQRLATQYLTTPAPINYEDEYYIQAGISHTNGATTAITLPKSVSGGAMARIKRTDAAGSWYIFDTIRGANKFLFGDTTAAEDDSTFDDQNLTGTTLTLPSGLATGTYVIEVFYMGSYFQIKLWTGTTAAISPTFATELDSENGMMLTMPRSVTIGNTFWHKNFTNVQYSQLSDTSVVATDRNNYSAISTTGFTAQADSAATDINTADATYVTYAWANSGPYQFGMYRGNRLADGPLTPSFGAPTTFTVKREDDSGTGEWHRLFQSRVLGDNENFQYLHDGRNSAINATATVHEMDFLSNGVKIRDAGNNGNNGTSADHIYGMFGIQPLTDGAINQGRADGIVKPYNQAHGGTITQAGGFWVHTFTSSGTFIPVVPMDVEYLVIAGGGGTSRYSGGGGAGGHLSATGFSVAATALTVTVGAGGAAGTSIGVVGGNSVFSSITATGGGYGKQSDEGGNGGSGGGGGSSDSVYDDSTGIDGQGNDGGSNSTSASGYPSGGGGGAGAVGGDASGSATGGVGGAGEANSITGTAVTRAGGGGGGTRSGTAGAGGAGGGGAGSVGSAAATAGTANTGGGAGGGGSTGAGAAGGSGIVIIKYAIS